MEERRIVRVTSAGISAARDQVVAEAPVEFRIAGVPIAVLMRSPGEDEDLARGFALTEGIVLHPGEIAAIAPAGDGDRYAIVLPPDVTVDPEQFRRNLYATSSCGLCGKASIDAVRVTAPALPPGPVVDPALLLTFPAAMERRQEAFVRTGAIHAAALFTGSGALLGLAEDVGRHNAVDKVIGRVTRERWPLGEVVLLVSGRVSFEITQKAAVAGIPFVAGVSGASSLAIDLAAELGLTLAGFLRTEGFNVYAGEERVASL